MKVQTEHMTLDKLPIGGRCIIEQVGSRRGAVKRRLIDMGLTPGAFVELIRTAPLGDPLEVRLRGYELSLRREDAAQIRVRPAAAREPEHKEERFCHGDCGHCGTASREREVRSDAPAVRAQRRAALAGNPNCGKTTLFNALTGSSQSVGNWPGVTVEKKEGEAALGDTHFTVVDLPGIYSLSPYSIEELTARRYLIGEPPDVIINIADASSLERSLYLTTQLLELERPVVLAVNFMDEAEKRGDVIDCGLLSACLGIPAVPVSARDGVNLDKLMRTALGPARAASVPDGLYDEQTRAVLRRVGALIRDRAVEKGIPIRWAAVQLLGGDGEAARDLELEQAVLDRIDAIAEEYESSSPLGDRETLLADSRYRFVEQVVRACVKRKAPGSSVTDRIDAVATHRLWAIPLFLGMMLTVFLLTFSGPGRWLSDGIAWFVEDVACPGVSGWLTALGAPELLKGLLVDGVISGVGGVLSFLPMIALLFLFLSLLEDSGYMARAAFVMDRAMRRFGLSGKAFIPMLMGFGCTVPAVMGARTMENEKDRRMTILLVPFMSCGARLPIYGLMTAAFFPRYGGLVVFCLYVLGPAIAILSGLLLKRGLFQGEPAPFLLELPPYRMPTLQNIRLQVWERVRDFLTRAGTVIAAMSAAVWFLQNFGTDLRMAEDSADSILAALGNWIAPVFAPMGFGVWQAAVALLAGLIAKEAIVSSMSLSYGFSLTDRASAGAALAGAFTPAAAMAFLVFCALYTPCIAAIAAIRREMGSLSWTALALVWQLCAAWLASYAAYQLAGLLL